MHRILYVSSQTEIGGAQQSFVDIIRQQDKSRFQAVVLLNRRGDLYHRLSELGVETVVVPFKTPLPFYSVLNPILWVVNFVALLRIARLVRRRRFVLIHCNDGASLYFISLAKMLYRTPVLYHVRWFERGVRKALVHLAATLWADKLVANSNAVRSYILTAMPRANPDVPVVHNAVDTETFHPRNPKKALRKELHLPDELPIIGMVGRYVGWKKHEVVIEAARILRDNDLSPIFCFVGTTQFEDYTPDTKTVKRSIEKLVHETRLDGQVFLLGYRKDIERVMAGFDVLVCPSENEPFGRVVIEAMASGVPVVAADSGGIPEIIIDGQNGLLFPVNDEDALARCIKRLLTDRELYQRMAHEGQRTVELKFSFQQLKENMDSVYSMVLSCNAGGSR